MICYKEFIYSDDPDILEQEERDQLRQWADLFVHALETPGCLLRRSGLNPVPDVHTCSTIAPVSQLCQPAPDEYNQFNLQNINTPTPAKWKNNENTLEDFRKFKSSCVHIFDGPFAHITNGKVKTNMF